MGRAETGFDAVDFEKCGKEFFQNPFQIGHGNILANRHTLDLMEHWCVGLVIVAAIHPTRRDHADRGAGFLHRADLHRRCVGTQNMRRAVVALGTVHIEGVKFLTGRMVRRDVQRVEIIPVILDLRTLGHLEPHIGENGGYFLGHLGHRMNGALGTGARWQGHIQPFAAQAFIQCSIGKACLFGGDG